MWYYSQILALRSRQLQKLLLTFWNRKIMQIESYMHGIIHTVTQLSTSLLTNIQKGCGCMQRECISKSCVL